MSTRAEALRNRRIAEKSKAQDRKANPKPFRSARELTAEDVRMNCVGRACHTLSLRMSAHVALSLSLSRSLARSLPPSREATRVANPL